MIQSTYSSKLTLNSQKYGRTGCRSSNYYYETLQINAITSSLYVLSSGSSIDTYGAVYKNYFNPLNPAENRLSDDDDSCGNYQFKLIADLQFNTTYILVVTTYDAETTGEFVIFVSGPNDVTLKRISKRFYFVCDRCGNKKRSTVNLSNISKSVVVTNKNISVVDFSIEHVLC